MLSYLAPVSDAVVAFEDCVPQVILPVPAAGESVDAYVARWRFSAAEPGGEPVVAEATKLGYSQRGNLEVAVDLAELIRGRDVGDWLLHVTGPIGRGLTAQLTLLPRMTLEVETKPGIAGPHLTPSKVRVTTREGIRILEAGGAAISSGDGWELVDLGRNGRIPFTVIDSDTGREATAMVVLPKVQWRWFRTGEAPSEPNQPLRLTPDAKQGVRLMAQGAGSHILRLSLVDGGGAIRKEETPSPSQGRGAVFGAGQFVAAAEALGLPRVKLRLALMDRAGVVLDDLVGQELHRPPRSTVRWCAAGERNQVSLLTPAQQPRFAGSGAVTERRVHPFFDTTLAYVLDGHAMHADLLGDCLILGTVVCCQEDACSLDPASASLALAGQGHQRFPFLGSQTYHVLLQRRLPCHPAWQE